MLKLRVGLAALVVWWAISTAMRPADLPERLTDQEFWALSQDSSEPGGQFRNADITNLTSNEMLYQHVIPDLIARAGTGRVYLGVGPEQNFTYMVAIYIRRWPSSSTSGGNPGDATPVQGRLRASSEDRAAFVPRCSRPHPPDYTTSSADRIFQRSNVIGPALRWVQKNPRQSRII